MPRKRFEWKFRDKSLLLGERTLVMGILNVTPDSFSDGGQFDDPDRAFAHAMELEEAGADIIDIGAESTRPGAARVPEAEELRRLVPVLKRLKGKLSVPISVDTYKAAVAEKAFEHGADIINDVSGLTFDPDLARVVSNANGGLIINHMRGTPETWLKLSPMRNVLPTIVQELDAAVHRALATGLERRRIMIDPGLGFGKRKEQNAEVLAFLDALARLELPILVGASRKHFLPADVEGRTEFATAAAIAISVLHGAHMIRVHDVGAMKLAAEVADEVLRVVQPGTEEAPESTVFRMPRSTPEPERKPLRPQIARKAAPPVREVVEAVVEDDDIDERDDELDDDAIVEVPLESEIDAEFDDDEDDEDDDAEDVDAENAEATEKDEAPKPVKRAFKPAAGGAGLVKRPAAGGAGRPGGYVGGKSFGDKRPFEDKRPPFENKRPTDNRRPAAGRPTDRNDRPGGFEREGGFGGPRRDADGPRKEWTPRPDNRFSGPPRREGDERSEGGRPPRPGGFKPGGFKAGGFKPGGFKPGGFKAGPRPGGFKPSGSGFKPGGFRPGPRPGGFRDDDRGPRDGGREGASREGGREGGGDERRGGFGNRPSSGGFRREGPPRSEGGEYPPVGKSFGPRPGGGGGGRPSGGRPGAKPFGAKPFGSKPFGGKPGGGKPFAGKPFKKKPGGAKPFKRRDD
jgi:dihydropteroate synthase